MNFDAYISTLKHRQDPDAIYLLQKGWDGAMEEAAKAVENLSPVAADAMTVAMAARAIRAMQTTAGAAGGEGK